MNTLNDKLFLPVYLRPDCQADHNSVLRCVQMNTKVMVTQWQKIVNVFDDILPKKKTLESVKCFALYLRTFVRYSRTYCSYSFLPPRSSLAQRLAHQTQRSQSISMTQTRRRNRAQTSIKRKGEVLNTVYPLAPDIFNDTQTFRQNTFLLLLHLIRVVM